MLPSTGHCLSKGDRTHSLLPSKFSLERSTLAVGTASPLLNGSHRTCLPESNRRSLGSTHRVWCLHAIQHCRLKWPLHAGRRHVAILPFLVHFPFPSPLTAPFWSLQLHTFLPSNLKQPSPTFRFCFSFFFFTSYAHLHYHYCSSFKSRYIPLNTKFTTSASDQNFDCLLSISTSTTWRTLGFKMWSVAPLSTQTPALPAVFHHLVNGIPICPVTPLKCLWCDTLLPVFP